MRSGEYQSEMLTKEQKKAPELIFRYGHSTNTTKQRVWKASCCNLLLIFNLDLSESFDFVAYLKDLKRTGIFQISVWRIFFIYIKFFYSICALI